MNNLDQLITQAKNRDKKAMENLLEIFKPLLKRQASRFYRMGLEFEDAYQQAALIFITGVFQYKAIPPVTFPGYIKKRINWGLWGYWRKIFGDDWKNKSF